MTGRGADPAPPSPQRPEGHGVIRAAALRAARLLERSFLAILVLVVALALLVPGPGRAMGGLVVPLFAAMMFVVSLTFHVGDVREALRHPLAVFAAVVLVFVPLPLLARALGPVVLGPGALALGLVLLAALPTDISAPLFTAMGGGSTALTAVVNAIVTALSPVILPVWFLALTGLRLTVPVASLVLELVAVVLVPTIVGVGVRTTRPSVGDLDAVWQAIAAFLYIVLVGIVVSQDAHGLAALSPGRLATVVAAVLALNLAGFALGLFPWLLTRRQPADRLAYSLALSEKEFSVAAAVVFAGGLDRDLLMPAILASIIQVVTATIVARRHRRRYHHHHPAG